MGADPYQGESESLRWQQRERPIHVAAFWRDGCCTRNKESPRPEARRFFYLLA
jgi:hypothetical protein